MGIQGLFTYILKYVESSLEWHKLHNCKIVIDGNNLAHEIYGNSPKLSSIYGADYDKYASYVEEFFRKLQKCKIRPYVVMDGGHPVQRSKFDTLYARCKEAISSGLNVSSAKKASCKNFPIMAYSVFANVIQQLGIPVIQCDFEADDEIAVIARKLGDDVCILSNDSDFYLFGSPFVLLNSMNFKKIQKEKYEDGRVVHFIPCYKFNPDEFCKITKVSKNLLPLFAPILGNDFSNTNIMRAFHFKIRHLQPSSRLITLRHKIIISVVKWLSQQTEEPIVVLDKVLDSLPFVVSEEIRKSFRSIFSMYFPSNTSLKPWMIIHSFSCPSRSKKKMNSNNLLDTESTMNYEGYLPDLLKAELQCICKDRVGALNIVNGVCFPDWFIKAYRLYFIPPIISDILNQDYLFAVPVIELEELRSVYTDVEFLLSKVRAILWLTVDEAYSKSCNPSNGNPISKDNGIYSKYNCDDVKKNYIPSNNSEVDSDVCIEDEIYGYDNQNERALDCCIAADELIPIKEIDDGSTSSMDQALECFVDEQNYVSLNIESENRNKKVGHINVEHSSNEDDEIGEISTESFTDIKSYNGKPEGLHDAFESICESISNKKELGFKGESHKLIDLRLSIAACESDDDEKYYSSNEFDNLDEQNSEPLIAKNEYTFLTKNSDELQSDDAYEGIYCDVNGGKEDDEDKVGYNEKYHSKKCETETQFCGVDNEMLSEQATLSINELSNHFSEFVIENVDTFTSCNRELEMKDQLFSIDEQRRDKRKKKRKKRKIPVSTSEEINILKIRDGIPLKLFQKHRHLPPMSWYIREKSNILRKELECPSIKDLKGLPSLFQVENMSLEEKRKHFYSICSLTVNFTEDVPPNIEFMLYCICAWRYNSHFCVDRSLVLSSLMCIMMFCVIDGKTGGQRLNGTPSNLLNKLNRLKKAGTLSDSSSLSISELVSSLTLEECQLAKITLLQFHETTPQLSSRMYDRKIIHSFSHFQVMIYFLQLVNGLLCFPFPYVPVNSFWSGSFCYNITKKMFTKKSNLTSSLFSLFGENTRIIELFLKLYNILKKTLKLPNYRSVEEEKMQNEGTIKDPKFRKNHQKKVDVIKELQCEKISNPSKQQRSLMAENRFSALLFSK